MAHPACSRQRASVTRCCQCVTQNHLPKCLADLSEIISAPLPLAGDMDLPVPVSYPLSGTHGLGEGTRSSHPAGWQDYRPAWVLGQMGMGRNPTHMDTPTLALLPHWGGPTEVACRPPGPHAHQTEGTFNDQSLSRCGGSSCHCSCEL